ncbi:MAG: hypothetical protein IPO92_13575 [Saprospiraceae bacterium]|nr:hypothetical protein [Saprospiraceae bacterium]
MYIITVQKGLKTYSSKFIKI